MISTKQLRYFDALARLGHFGRAAEQCAITQPALSMQIAQLERDLGVPLVERHSSGVMLTPAGSDVAKRAGEILCSIRALSEFANSCAAPLSSPIRFGVIPTVAPYLLPKLLPRVREQHPKLRLFIRETQTNALVADLLAGTLDLLVLALPIDSPEIESIELHKDRFLLAVPAADSSYAHTSVQLDFLQGERLLLLEEGHCFRDQALAVCRLNDIDGSELLGAASLSTLVQMVASGLGVTLLPEIGAAHESTHSNIRLLRFIDPEPSRTIGLAWRKSTPRKAEFLLLGDMLKKLFVE